MTEQRQAKLRTVQREMSLPAGSRQRGDHGGKLQCPMTDGPQTTLLLPSLLLNLRRSRVPNKLAAVIALLQRKDGATLDELSTATGWLKTSTLMVCACSGVTISAEQPLLICCAGC